MSTGVVLKATGLVAWACCLYGVLSLAQLETAWDHALCGPWGCGPRLGAVAGYHLFWLVILVPAAMVVPRLQGLTGLPWRAIGALVSGVAVLALLGLTVFEYQTWYLTADQTVRPYFAERVGFAIATWVDLPVVQTLTAGLVLVSKTRTKR